MKKLIILTIIAIINLNIVFGQNSKLQIGVQTGFTIPTGQFASGYGPYVDNGYASTGINYKVYAEYRIKGVLCVGLNYINFSNSQEEGNLRVGYNNIYTSYKTKVLEKSSSQGIIGSVMLKGTESPLFIKGFLGIGYSKTGSVSSENYINSFTEIQSTSDLGVISGIGIGFYIPIKNKWFIELEADYFSSAAKPKNYLLKDNKNDETINLGDISYNQTVFNINVGIGIFLLRD